MLYTELDAEYRHILEKRRMVKENKENEARELELKTEAALLIQAWWRGYCIRKALKERQKKGKKEKTLKKRERIGKGQKDKKVNR